MKKLVTIKFDHYSPKDYESGIKEFVITNDHESVTNYVDDEHMYGRIKDDETEEKPSKREVSAQEVLTNQMLQPDPAKYGVVEEKDRYSHTFNGTFAQLARWSKKVTWDSTEDGYYGVTLWDWADVQDISDTDAEVLVRLGIAKLLENTND